MRMLGMKNKVVIITEANRGIGKDMECFLARKGAVIVAAGSNSHDKKPISEILDAEVR